VEADADKLGKSVGKDERDDKSTFVTLLGLQGAKDKLAEEEEACYKNLDYLSSQNMDIMLLRDLTDFNLKRDY
jgi:geranylgeranyl diphosphate synthase type II